ncbi:MAG: hypothetical protein KGZ40_09235 [Clostridiales bacterium]|nr:hypothetical protein [Clostridiales bacterium]
MFVKTHGISSHPNRLFSPFAVLLYVYTVYFLLGLSDIYEFVYWELMNLGLRMIGYQPTIHTVLLYAYGALLLVLGNLLGARLARRMSKVAGSSASGGIDARARMLWERIGSCVLFKRYGFGFTIMLAGWALAFSANALQLYIGRASLFDIATRWQQSPVLVFIAALNIMFVPGLFVFARTRGQRILAAALFGVTVASLGLLGARHLPAKLIISAFLGLGFVLKPRTMLKAGVAFFLMLVLAMGVIGAVSKSGIYGLAATWKVPVALTYADSAGTTYNLDRIVRMTPVTGVYGGVLLKDSALALIPGLDSEYANYQLGRYLGGREAFDIGGQRIERSVSLAPTLLGAPYADWGVPGVVGQMLLLGLLFGYLQARSTGAPWLIPPFVILASYVINGVNAGVHNPNTIAFIALAVFVCVVDAFIVRRVPSLYSTLEPR